MILKKVSVREITKKIRVRPSRITGEGHGPPGCSRWRSPWVTTTATGPGDASIPYRRSGPQRAPVVGSGMLGHGVGPASADKLPAPSPPPHPTNQPPGPHTHRLTHRQRRSSTKPRAQPREHSSANPHGDVDKDTHRNRHSYTLHVRRQNSWGRGSDVSLIYQQPDCTCLYVDEVKLCGCL